MAPDHDARVHVALEKSLACYRRALTNSEPVREEPKNAGVVAASEAVLKVALHLLRPVSS